MTTLQMEALGRARGSTSKSNLPTVYQGFLDKGIALDDIRPRENVLTYHAWRALGRQVRKGEHGVKITTWIPCEERPKNGETPRKSLRPKCAVVFHVMQTDPV